MGKKTEHQWEVIRLKGSPAKFVGFVYAADQKRALEAAIEEYKIRPEHQKALLVRRT
jgi:1,2-phenylacetyl-CoA epoxidase PaaB subunit